MELIVFPIVFIYFLWLNRREQRQDAAEPWRITADATIERDESGQIRTICIRLS